MHFIVVLHLLILIIKLYYQQTLKQTEYQIKMCFRSIIGNDTTYHHCIVLYVYDQRTILHKSIEDGEILSTKIYVVTKKIDPELGEKTWRSILRKTI